MGFFGGFRWWLRSAANNQIDQNRKSEADKQEALLETQVAPIAARLKDPKPLTGGQEHSHTQLMKVYAPRTATRRWRR